MTATSPPLAPKTDPYRAAFRKAFHASSHNQNTLAKAVGVTRGAVCMWVSGTVGISSEHALAVGTAIGVDPRLISAQFNTSIAPHISILPTGDAALDRAIVSLVEAARLSDVKSVTAAAVLLQSAARSPDEG